MILNDLQTALIPLAKGAGMEVYEEDDHMPYGPPVRITLVRKPGDIFGDRLVGASGTLRLEDVGLVLGWLAKAGYSTMVIPPVNGRPLTISIYHKDHLDDISKGSVEGGDTLNEALAEAVKALPIEAKA